MPSDPDPSLLSVLEEVRASRLAIESRMEEIDRKLGQLASRPTPQAGATSAPQIADDNDLDSQWGNPTVRR